MRTPAPLAPGDPSHAGRFRLLGRLAQGGMGLVYLARRDDSPESLVAVKMIRPELQHEPALRDLFAREIEAAQRLGAAGSRETHVARTVAADATAEQPWLASEFVPGPSLADEAAFRPQTPDRVVGIARDLAAAVAAMHAEGLLHGDLKPTNVVLGPDGLRLVDLGLAREHACEDVLATGFGSPGWSPPEVGDLGAVTPAADVHGWGMTVAYAATGRPAFGTGPAVEVHERMRTSAPDTDGVPAALAPLVERALHPQPAQRPTAAELLAELEPLRNGAAPVAPDLPAEDPTPTGALAAPTLLDAFTTETPRRRRSLLPVLAVGAVTAALLVVGALLLALVGTGTQPAPEDPAKPAARTASAAALQQSPSAAPTTSRAAAAAVAKKAPAPAATTKAAPAAPGTDKATKKDRGQHKGHGPDKPGKH
ncbi:MAG: serine/threonine-protein kinase [Candidatus Nanopelagicales bacterium]